jgi:hypothetical protein
MLKAEFINQVLNLDDKTFKLIMMKSCMKSNFVRREFIGVSNDLRMTFGVTFKDNHEFDTLAVYVEQDELGGLITNY